MKLKRGDYEFNNPRISYIMPKHIDLDRVLIGLYMLLKYRGRRPVARAGRHEVDLDYLVDHLIEQHGASLRGFSDHREIVADWLYSDLVDIVFRGYPDREQVASPRPLHLNAYKLRNARYSKDYHAPEHLYSMLQAADPELITRLSKYLGAGMDPANDDMYDDETPLDLDTLMVVRMVDNPRLKENPSGDARPPEFSPLCVGQARLMSADLRRLLVYEQCVPEPVLITYLRSAFGFHLGLYLLRLFNQLSGWTADKAANPTCLACPVQPEALFAGPPEQDAGPFAVCPYAFQNSSAKGACRQPEILVDMGEDYKSRMAQLSHGNCALQYGRITDYVHAVFTVNSVFQYAESQIGRRDLMGRPLNSVAQALDLLTQPPSGIDYYFGNRIDDVLGTDSQGDDRDDVNSIRKMGELSPQEIFVELVALDRTRYYRKYLNEQVDSLLMKNADTGLVRQGKGKGNERRWHLGTRLLEMLVQIAVLEPSGHGNFRSRPILIDDLVRWLCNRYGLVVAPQSNDATIADYEAFNSNLSALKERLREIGFYTDLSDAYNAQVIRPRYSIGEEAQP